MIINNCKWCGKEIKTKRKDKIFCNSSCYNKFYNKKNGKKVLKKTLKKNPNFYKDKYQKYKKHYKDYYEKNKEKIALKVKEVRRKNWSKYTFDRLKNKCKREKIKFTIKETDLKLPKKCPILGIILVLGRKNLYNSPSVDRINNSQGYLKGNIQVISFSANAMKSDMPIGEWKKFLKERLK